MTLPKVDIGVACSSYQHSTWWGPLLYNLLSENGHTIDITHVFNVSAALPDAAKNANIGKNRNKLTDANRTEIVKGFMNSEAEWLFQLDDDVVFPKGTIGRLIRQGRDFIAGLYFHPKLKTPIAYYRKPDGLYDVLKGYPDGSMIQVDAVGMGCTLIHKSVFERILDAYVVYERPDGSLFPILKKNVIGAQPKEPERKETRVRYGVLEMPVVPQSDDREFPFFLMEYGRTEDLHFCELAGAIGIRPWIDTSLTCSHFKVTPTTVKDYKEALVHEGA